MAQVQVFTNGKWVGAGSQTVDPSNRIDMIINPIMFYRPASPTFGFQVGYKQKYTGSVGGVNVMAPEDLASLVITGTSGTSGLPLYPMIGKMSSFPDGTKVVCYGYKQADTSGGTLPDSQNVFMIGIPLEDVNVDTKMEMVWYPQGYGQVADYVSGAVDGALRYKFDMVRIAPVGGSSNPAPSTIAFFAVTWGMIRAAMKLKPTAVAGNILGYDGNWQTHTVQFRKTILA